MQAVAAGVRVVAGAGCGLDGVPGVTTIPEGDVPRLVEVLSASVAPTRPVDTIASAAGPMR